jgi:hypothetical protein
MKSADKRAAVRIQRDWNVLCGDIGERRAGTPAESRAAEFIATQLAAAGCSGVKQETFPCVSLRSARVRCEVREGRRWTSVESAALVGAPGTPDGKPVEGGLVWLEMPENAGRLTPGCLRGRIAALFGPLPTDLAHHKRLVAAKPAAVIHIDERLPFPWIKNDGVYPLWAQRHGMPPTITVPYTEAWRWRKTGLTRVRLAVRVELAPARSQNVIAELPGRQARLPAIVISAHHDTPCGNPGADDNGSGVMCLLELARRLASRPHRRSVRFISFGAEEQLSVGSAAYVRLHRRELARTTGLVVNFDSVSSPLGHFEMSCVGADALALRARRALAVRGLDIVLRREVTPFVDNFPFNWAGVPSLWFARTNCPAGRWQHHSRHDTLAHVSMNEVIRLLGAVTPLVIKLAGETRWTFPRGLPAAQQVVANRFGRELYGLCPSPGMTVNRQTSGSVDARETNTGVRRCAPRVR